MNIGIDVNLPSERRDRGHQVFERLDDVDRRIIQQLQADARLRTAELGRRVGLSPPAVAERMRRRFRVREMYVVGDRGMISEETLATFGAMQPPTVMLGEPGITGRIQPCGTENR